MDLSVIIVSFNTKQLLDNCLRSLIQSLKGTNIKFEIIVIDNVSKDGTREMLRKKYAQVITVENGENVGFGRANNQGIRISKGKFILLLNSDTVILNNAVGKLYDFAVLHDHNFVGPKLFNIDKTPQTSCGPFFTLPVVFAAMFLKGDVNGLTRWSPDSVKQVDWVSGACIIAPKKLFMDNLLFDEQVFMYMEEVDLFMRARAKGYITLFYPDSQIIHIGSGSSTNKRTGPVLNIYRGLLYVYKKHYSSFSLFILKFLLKCKALIAIGIGRITGSGYLRQTYEEAYRLV